MIRRQLIGRAGLGLAALCCCAAALPQEDARTRQLTLEEALERIATEEPTPFERQTPSFQLSVRGAFGSERVDLTANRARLDVLLEEVGRRTQRDVAGLELLTRAPIITSKLLDAELRDALRWIGGSVGLSIIVTTSAIRVTEDIAPYPTRGDLYDRAATGYFRALVDHPSAKAAPLAAWNRARIEASRSGRALETARAFDAIVTTYPTSDLVPDALLEAGRWFGLANAWDEAVTRFDTLAGLPRRHDHALTARRLLADGHTRIAEAARNPVVAAENARRGLLVLDALDDHDPDADEPERRARSIIRSRAHSLVGEPVKALKALDIAARYSPRGENDVELAELRARAFERSGRYPDAVRAWLRYGDLAGGDAKITAFVHAADAANEGREHLTAIAIAKTARNEGFGEALAAAEAAAYAGLDMEPDGTDLFGDPERLQRGEQLVSKRLYEEAVDALRPVYERRAHLEEDEAKRLALGYGRALAEIGRTDEMLLVLRRLVDTQRSAADRRELYLFAADALEAAGDIERAIAALEGRL
ncbi:MAG: hypothetical protein AAFU73_00180 [Planctomycetota bacterium]